MTTAKAQPETASALGRAALWYAMHLGWRVFPLHSVDAAGCSCGSTDCAAGKHPRSPRGCLDATTDGDTISAWWQRWPDANIGVATGAGLVVLDIDPRHGGGDSFDDAKRRLGAIPDTVEALTGGGGRHIYFALPEGVEVRNSANVIGQGLDVRGEGGYVVAAPSVHASGASYGWEASSRPGEVEVAMVPATWLAAMTTRPKLRVLPGGAGEPIPSGTRNETLFRRASSMRAAGFERDAIFAAVSSENEARCSPPVDPAEVKALVESVCKYAPGLSPEYERERLAAEARRAEAEGRLDIERTLIATVLLDAGKRHEALARMFALVSPGDLENPRHATIAEVVRMMDAKGSTIDPATVVDELRVRSRIGAAGGPEYVAQVCSRPPSFDDIEEYAGRIAKRAHLRAVKGIVEKARSDLDAQGDPMELVAKAKATIAEMPDGLRGVADSSMHAHAITAYDRVFASMNARRAGQNRCARWGVETLDGDPSSNDAQRAGALGGLFDGKLYLLGGEAGAGKTTLAWQAVIATARGTDTTPGRPVLVVSLEMDGPEINCRLAGQLCGLTEERLEHGSISDEEFGRFQRALSELAQLPIHIVSDCETVEDVAARVHGMRARGDLSLVVLDYLQLLRLAHGGRDENRADAERIQALKRLAVRAKIPLLAITSMTKAGQRNAREGKVSSDDARGSGLEYAADVIAFLLRAKSDDVSDTPEVVFHMTKRRGGRISRPSMRFVMNEGRFEHMVTPEFEVPQKRPPKTSRGRGAPAQSTGDDDGE